MPKPSALLSLVDRRFGESVRQMTASNPFLPARIAAERAALGDEFEERGADWNTRPPGAESYAQRISTTGRALLALLSLPK